MSDLAMLPFHPVTGVQAIGFGKRGPIWPVMGGSEDAGEGGSGTDDSGEEGGAEGGDAGTDANEWWQFSSKAEAEEWGNGLVTKRLQRERKSKLDPVVQERDTLKAEVERLRPLADKDKTADQKWEEKLNTLNSEVSELRSYRAKTERENLVRSIAEDEGLPSSFLSRVRGDDEDAIRDDIKDLLNGLSEAGSDTSKKKTPPAKAPKPEKSGGGSVSSGGGSSSDESDDALSKSILEEIAQQRKNGGLLVTRRSR